MAGKLHENYARYLDASGDVPKVREARAYAEGYVAWRDKGALQNTNPFANFGAGRNYDWEAWDQGWQDANQGKPSTHVGGPNATAALEDEDELITRRRSRK